MSSPPRPPTTPAPNHRAGPSTPGTAHSIANCTEDAAVYTTVIIHTAKCSECDERNKATMRRCPGCSFQICQPCFDARMTTGRSLVHGNLRTPSIAPTPVVRRRPFNSSVSKATPLKVVKDEKKENAQEVTSPKTDSRKRDRKAKKSTPTKDFASEDDFEADPDSSMRPSKRQKTAESTYSPGNSLKTSSPGNTGRRTTTQHQAGRQGLRSSPLRLLNPQAVGGHSTLLPEMPDIFQQHGIDVTYEAHPLARHTPVLRNPTVVAPPQWHLKPRKSQEEIERAIQDKTRSKLNAQQRGRNETEAGSNGSPAQVSEVTIRTLVETEAHKLQQGVQLHRDQQESLVFALKEVGRNFGNNVYSEIPLRFRQLATPGLDMEVDSLTKWQKQELAKVIQEEAARKLKALEVEAELYTSTASPILHVQSAPITKTGDAPPPSPTGTFGAARPQYGPNQPIIDNKTLPSSNSTGPSPGKVESDQATRRSSC